MVIGFWNIGNNTALGDVLIDFVKENDIDILLLAERFKSKKNKRKCVADDVVVEFLKKSKSRLSSNFEVVPNDDFRVAVLSNLDLSVFNLKSSLFTSSRWSAFHINIPGIIQLNLFPVHFYSKVNWPEFSLALECVNFARDIVKVEDETNCTNSILIGDFNMSPFEQGLVASNGINALQDLEYVFSKKKGREIDGSHYRYFYNPMWNFLGDNSTPYGTIYHRVAGHVSHEWHLYDQVILRPELKNYLKKNSVKIITEILGQSLLKQFNRPNDEMSDHLPIVIELTI